MFTKNKLIRSFLGLSILALLISVCASRVQGSDSDIVNEPSGSSGNQIIDDLMAAL